MIELLADHLWAHRQVPFQYGIHDCGTFAVHWIDSRLGTSYAPMLSARIERDGLSKTLRAVRRPGGYRALIVEMTETMPLEDKEWKVGDIAVFLQENGTETLGITARRLVHSPGASGVVSFDAQRIMCYWKLECLKQFQ